MSRAVPARIPRRPGRTRGRGRDGRAAVPPDRASPAAGAWTRAVAPARLDRLRQGDGARRGVQATSNPLYRVATSGISVRPRPHPATAGKDPEDGGTGR